MDLERLVGCVLPAKEDTFETSDSSLNILKRIFQKAYLALEERPSNVIYGKFKQHPHCTHIADPSKDRLGPER